MGKKTMRILVEVDVDFLPNLKLFVTEFKPVWPSFPTLYPLGMGTTLCLLSWDSHIKDRLCIEFKDTHLQSRSFKWNCLGERMKIQRMSFCDWWWFPYWQKKVLGLHQDGAVVIDWSPRLLLKARSISAGALQGKSHRLFVAWRSPTFPPYSVLHFRFPRCF